MSVKIYCDTCIYLDFLFDRKSISGNRNLGEEASYLFGRAVKCYYTIVFSDWILDELKKQVDISQYQMLSSMLEKKIEKVAYTKEDIDRAKQLCPGHFQDALHMILAEKTNCEYLITQNLDDFILFSSKVQPRKPTQI